MELESGVELPRKISSPQWDEGLRGRSGGWCCISQEQRLTIGAEHWSIHVNPSPQFLEHVYCSPVKERIDPFDKRSLTVSARSVEANLGKPRLSFDDHVQPRRLMIALIISVNSPVVKSSHYNARSSFRSLSKMMIRPRIAIYLPQVFTLVIWQVHRVRYPRQWRQKRICLRSMGESEVLQLVESAASRSTFLSSPSIALHKLPSQSEDAPFSACDFLIVGRLSYRI